METKWNINYLEKQANYELKYIKTVFQNIGINPKETYTILDIGCSDGYSTNLVFGDFANSTILGIDIDKERILQAATKKYGNNFHFKYIYLLYCDINSFINQFGKFDIIYCSYVIQYLESPLLFLNLCHQLLKKNGKIIIKASDDNGKIAYPGADILEEIISLYGSCIMQNVDRFCASKCYSWLVSCNFHNIKYNHFIEDTTKMSLQEKNDLYYRDFSFREVTFSNIDASNMLIDRYILLLTSMQKLFQQDNFYYCSTSYIITADY